MFTIIVGEKPKISLQKFLAMDAYTRLQDERELTILVDNEVFYYQPLFPILELAETCYFWLQQPNNDFEYVTIEAEDNPMLKFTRTSSGFLISSPWQKFSYTAEFTKEEVACFCREIVNRVIDKEDM